MVSSENTHPVYVVGCLLRCRLEDGFQFVICYDLAITVPEWNLVCMATFHGNQVVTLWVAIVSITVRGRGAIGTEQPV